MPLDIALGLAGAFLQALIAPEDFTIRLLLLGVVFALFPDVDFLVSAVRRGSLSRVDHTHRELLHHPVPYLLCGGAVVALVAPHYLLMFLALSCAHFLHDTIGVGWGIPWLSPFSRRHLKLFVDARNAYAPRGYVFWSVSARDALIRERGDRNWIRNLYARPTYTALVEIGLLFVAFAGVLLLTRYL